MRFNSPECDHFEGRLFYPKDLVENLSDELEGPKKVEAEETNRDKNHEESVDSAPLGDQVVVTVGYVESAEIDEGHVLDQADIRQVVKNFVLIGSEVVRQNHVFGD